MPRKRRPGFAATIENGGAQSFACQVFGLFNAGVFQGKHRRRHGVVDHINSGYAGFRVL